MGLLVLAPALPEGPGARAAGAAAPAGAEIQPGAPRSEAPAPLAPPLRELPLATIRITGGFGESRSNHFHAGLDFSTGGHVGEPVRAPLTGWIERVHVSGAGYGRSLYLHADDGRTLVFGHLDAYAGAAGAYADSVQRAAGQYEQDLWPAERRFRVAAGDTIAWSGDSGAGGPHLHMEVRHGDFALDPLRAGVSQPAEAPPRLEALVLEPLDERSFVNRSAAPFALRFGLAREETLVVEGRVRAVVRSRAGLPHASGVPAWSTSAQWNGRVVEARLDSISWAGEMSEQDEVVDRGSVDGSMGFILEHRASFTPRFLRVPGEAWDGVIEVAAGDPARALALEARDAEGLAASRRVWLRGPRAGEAGPDTNGVTPRRSRGPLRWAFASLPGARLRITLTGLPALARGVRIGADPGDSRAATLRAGAWSAVFESRALSGVLVASARVAAAGAWTQRLEVGRHACGESVASTVTLADAGATLELPAAGLYEPLTLVTRTLPRTALATHALVAVSASVEAGPAHTALRHPAAIAIVLPEGEREEHVDLYRTHGAGWSALRATWDARTRTFRTETSELGTFALLRDDVPPRIVPRRPLRRFGATAPYPRWRLEARVLESGSGVDAAASAFVVDGVRVPSEWDPEASVLRWRPRQPPAPGRHAYEVRVADRAGNTARSTGSFVLDSVRR